MLINELSKRHIIFTHQLKDWDLHIHVIRAEYHTFIIDTGLGSSSIQTIVDYIGSDTKPIIIINTHYHWDHIWGNFCFKDSLIVSHTLCYDIINEKWEEMYTKNQEYILGKTEKMLPNMVFDNILSFKQDGITLFYTPGHTIDGISIYDEKEQVLNVGDNIGDSLDDIIPSLATDTLTFKTTLQKYKDISNVQTCISCHIGVVPPSIFDEMLDIL